ncbi:hypothetical protein C8R47DRAFT_1222728 [Mycena vitilis]|nr:hypothetical protein C8R47DRAFT_1222728 [Mycena vitilis]
MPRAGTARRKRERQGLGPVNRGRVSWVHGSKLPFLHKFKDAYRVAVLQKGQTKFYDKVAQEFVGVYGHNLDWNADLQPGQDVASDVDENEDVDELPAAEGKRRRAFVRKLREKIGYWFRGNYGGMQRKSKKLTTFRQLFDKPELDPVAPARPRVTHFYSRKCYGERIKPLFEKRWGEVSALPNPPAPIKVRNAATAEAWAAEPEPFKKEVLAALKAEHDAAQGAYQALLEGDSPKTAEEFDLALNNCARYLQPFANAIHEHLGMNVSIMMCGPIPDRGGAIEVRSLHAGSSKDMVPRIWPDFDRGGFDEVERSMVEFSRHCYSGAERRERALGNMQESPADTRVDDGVFRSDEGLPPPAQTTPPTHPQTTPPAHPDAPTRPAPPAGPAPVADEDDDDMGGGLDRAGEDENEEDAAAAAAVAAAAKLAARKEAAKARAGKAAEAAKAAAAAAAAAVPPILVRPEESTLSFGPLNDPALALALAQPQYQRPEGSPFGPLLPTWEEVAGDQSKWPAELGSAYAAFRRLSEWGGWSWLRLIWLFLRAEEELGWTEGKGLRLLPVGKRPEEVEAFMKWGRKWQTPQRLVEGGIGPRTVAGSIADRWWSWWPCLLPPARMRPDFGDISQPDDIPPDHWVNLARANGRNGMLMVLACLLWWGEAAAAVKDASMAAELADDWRFAVEDAIWSYESAFESGQIDRALQMPATDPPADTKKGKKRRGEAAAKPGPRRKTGTAGGADSSDGPAKRRRKST